MVWNEVQRKTGSPLGEIQSRNGKLFAVNLGVYVTSRSSEFNVAENSDSETNNVLFFCRLGQNKKE